MVPQNKPAVSPLAGQNLWLRLLILVIALFGALEASPRQLLYYIGLILVFMLLDLSLYPKLLKGLRISLPFFAAYWVFGTLFGILFTDMILFTLKLIFFIGISVYVFGNLTQVQALEDTRWLRRYRWGRGFVRYCLATGLYINAYTRYFAEHKPKGSSSIGKVLDSLLDAGSKIFKHSDVVEAQLARAMVMVPADTDKQGADLIGLCLLALIVLVSSF
jgi:hypothetical protein